jgi:hypothetical protein
MPTLRPCSAPCTMLTNAHPQTMLCTLHHVNKCPPSDHPLHHSIPANMLTWATWHSCQHKRWRYWVVSIWQLHTYNATSLITRTSAHQRPYSMSQKHGTLAIYSICVRCQLYCHPYVNVHTVSNTALQVPVAVYSCHATVQNSPSAMCFAVCSGRWQPPCTASCKGCCNTCNLYARVMQKQHTK